MPKLTLENIPDELHARLCEQAQRHDRSVAEEVMRILERQLAVPESDADASRDDWDPVAKAEQINRRLGRTFPDIVNEAKREGRA